MNARKLIYELITSPQDYNWESETKASFVSANVKYHVDIGPRYGFDRQYAEIRFYEEGKSVYDKTGNHDSFKVLSTVITILNDFMKRNPEKIVLIDGTDFRQIKIYRKGIKKYAYKLNFNYVYGHSGLLVSKSVIPSE